MNITVLVYVSRVENLRLDNYLIIPNALLRAGCKVLLSDITTISLRDSIFYSDCYELDSVKNSGERLDTLPCTTRVVDDIDLVWSLASPHPDIYLETFQMLWVLNQRVPFVNDASALLFLNNKITLSESIPREYLPESHVVSDYRYLFAKLEEDREQTWVLKPANEGCGADVYLISMREKNARALVQSATGNEVANHERYGRPTIGSSRKFAAVQKYVPNVTENEKRVLIVGGIPVCGFRRYHHEDDHRANVTLGNKFDPLTLTKEEALFCRHLGKRLMALGIYYAGLDLAFPYVLELNLVNPGALNYSYKASGIDQSDEAISHLFNALKKKKLIL
ncbi:ATP-grasp domain-containing protein [Dickeya poaceiphila]|uniref:Glutathione synthase n=1 Tax=Dickeya poaceiphila TaxID=568768 RepID=A0A5B8HLE2_9GAMM|nr:glutathione synthase [Dickeya poaceiphila]QDX29916.1 glutathione synthase [Dickeya poaceiphila]